MVKIKKSHCLLITIASVIIIVLSFFFADIVMIQIYKYQQEVTLRYYSSSKHLSHTCSGYPYSSNNNNNNNNNLYNSTSKFDSSFKVPVVRRGAPTKPFKILFWSTNAYVVEIII